jgi:prepilin-type N-terminal cleavage/methylation domain-containing protein
MWNPKTSLHGFTLIELAVVILVIAILAGLALPVFTSVQEKARITQDLSNLRQLGIGTQTYLNDHDGILFTSGGELHPKYLPSWKIFQSPFDTRAASEDDTNSPISYGLNGNSTGLSMDKVQKPTLFILFAPAQNSNAQVQFSGTAGSTLTVLRALSTPPGVLATGGTQNKRTRIDALFADLHCDNLLWTTFKMDPTGPTDDPSRFRWDP